MSGSQMAVSSHIPAVLGRKADMQFTKAEEYGVFRSAVLGEVDRFRVVPLSEISES